MTKIHISLSEKNQMKRLLNEEIESFSVNLQKKGRKGRVKELKDKGLI